MNKEQKRRSFSTVVFWYGSLPLITVFVLFGVFFLVSFSTNNNYLAAFAAFVPCFFVLWKWVGVSREVDRWRCARCGQPVKNVKKMPWTYPPESCPHCGDTYV
jgi:ABC-type maltose transport system permease subunit